MSGAGGAEYLASIFGTEKDKVNCSFYFKTGACRHGDSCSRIHNKPPTSQTLVLKNMYIPPLFNEQQQQDAIDHYEDFYDDIFGELSKFGPLQDVVVCENAGPHLAGNVYAKFDNEDSAGKAFAALNGRFYGGRPVFVEYSPVTDFWEGVCKQLEKDGECSRGANCNFMHLKKISYDLEKDLYPNGRGERKGYSGGGYGRSKASDAGDGGGYGGGGGGGYGGGGGGPPRGGGGPPIHYGERRGGYDRRGGGYDRRGGDRYDRRGGDRYDRRGGDRGDRYDRRGGPRGDRDRSPPPRRDRDRSPRRDRSPPRDRSEAPESGRLSPADQN